MMELSKTKLQVIELDTQLMERCLFSREHKKKLKEQKDVLKHIIEDFSYIEEPTWHDIMVYANAKAIMDLPEHQINIFITRTLIFKSTEDMACQLNVCRPTLTRYIIHIKQTIKKNANDIIKSIDY